VCENGERMCEGHYAGRKGGFDVNVMASYIEYGDQAADGEFDMYTIYLLFAHASAPNKFGGCKWNDRTWSKRMEEHDTCTWQDAVSAARAAVEEFDAGCAAERDHATADMLACGVLIPGDVVPEGDSDDDGMYDGVCNVQSADEGGDGDRDMSDG
jgi:hypothetical protein